MYILKNRGAAANGIEIVSGLLLETYRGCTKTTIHETKFKELAFHDRHCRLVLSSMTIKIFFHVFDFI